MMPPFSSMLNCMSMSGTADLHSACLLYTSSEGLRNVTAGADALGIRRGIQKATDAIVDAIKADATPVSTKEQIANVGTISAGDAEIGEKIDVYKRQPLFLGGFLAKIA